MRPINDVMDRAIREGCISFRPRQGEAMQRCVNVLAMVKDGERFVFLYDDDSIPETLQTLGRFAADPELNFTWYDAAVLCQKLRDAQSAVEQQRTFFRESA